MVLTTALSGSQYIPPALPEVTELFKKGDQNEYLGRKFVVRGY